MLEEAMERLVGLMTLRWRGAINTKRRLMWREHRWSLATTPDTRLEKHNLRGWNTLRQCADAQDPELFFIIQHSGR